MKTRNILLALGLTVIAAGCQKNIDDLSVNTPVGKKETITVRAVKNADTKTVFWEDDDNIYHRQADVEADSDRDLSCF